MSRVTHHCGRFRPRPPSRRELLAQASCGFGSVAAAALLAEGAAPGEGQGARHHPARASAVIFLYMDGGVSQVDSFDPKPLLARDAGKNPRDLFKVDQTQFNAVGTLLPSPWTFARHGQSGL